MPLRVAVFTKNRSNPAYEAARLGADIVATRLGAQAMHYVPSKDDDPDEQTALVDQALAQRPDALVFTPVHATRMNAAVERMHASGIPIFGFVNPLPVGRCVTYVGSDDADMGRAIARYLYAHLDGRGRVLLISGPLASVTSAARMRSFLEAATQHPGIVIAGTCAGDYARDVARGEVARWLAANEAPDACLAANDVMALGAIDALGSARRRPALAGINAIPEAIAAIKRGEMLATANFDAMQMAALATECAVRHLRGERVPQEIDLPVEIVDRRNCHLWDVPYERRPVMTLEEALASGAPEIHS